MRNFINMNELDYVEIGKRIKIKRKEQKLTQEKLSEIIDVSPSYISEIERGTSISSLSISICFNSMLVSIIPFNTSFTFLFIFIFWVIKACFASMKTMNNACVFL